MIHTYDVSTQYTTHLYSSTKGSGKFAAEKGGD